MSARQALVEELPHDCDSYFGRPHVDARDASSEQVYIRLLLQSDIDSGMRGRPGVDFRIKYSYQDSGVLTPGQYVHYRLVHRNTHDLALIGLYDWLKSQGIPVISNIVRVTEPWSEGVAFGVLWSYRLAYLSVGSCIIGDRVVRLLQEVGIYARVEHGSSRLCIEFPLDALMSAKVEQ